MNNQRDKAEELISKFYNNIGIFVFDEYHAKDCAIICVEEIILMCKNDEVAVGWWNGVVCELNKLDSWNKKSWINK